MARLVVIGGDAAGMSAASKARRMDSSLEIVALEAGSDTSYSQCGLPYYVAGLVNDPNRLVARTPQQFHAMGIDVRLRHRAVALDRQKKEVRAVDGDTGHQVIFPYDHVVIATGARPRPLGIPGEHLPGVLALRDLRDGIAVRSWVEKYRASREARAVVVGAGFVGLEMAETFLSLGFKTTVVQRSAQVLSDLDAEMAALIRAELERQGATVLLGSRVDALEGDSDGVRHVCLEGGGQIDADVVLVAVGVLPNAELAVGAGLPAGAGGAIAVDETQRTEDPAVLAAGDCAHAYHRVTRAPAWVPLGTTANKQGRVAGENVAGGYARFAGILGTFITRVCDLEVAMTGLSLKHAIELGLDAVAVDIKSTDIAGYFPGARPLTIRLIGERGTGRLLGGQLVGGGAKRVDTIATAIHAEMCVTELGQVDLAYAPPFSSVWDPVLVAAQELNKRL